MMSKTAPILEMLFQGGNVAPELIPIASLSQAFSSVQRLASGKEEDPEATEESVTSVPPESLRLIGIKKGSAIYQIVGGAEPQVAIAHLKQAGHALRHPDETDESSDYIVGPVETLSRIARSLSCTIILCRPGQVSRPLLKIEGESFQRFAGSMFIEGVTSFTGRVERVGGATQNRCALRVLFQHRLIYCSVDSQDLARQLGEKLYQDVAVEGIAKWHRSSWKIFDFKIQHVYQPKRKPIHEAFEALRSAGGKGWDRIDDPGSFIKEVSGE